MLRFWKQKRCHDAAASPRRELFAAPSGRFERLTYVKAAAIVAAKLAKCDGPVKRSEIDAFKRLFPLSEQEHAEVAPLFDLARESPQGFEPFAGEIIRMAGEERAEREALFARFVRVGEADGALNGEELGFLGTLAGLLDVEQLWDAIQAQAGTEGDPYVVLGVARDVSDDELRAAWHRLIRRFHPDAAAARGEEGGDHLQVAAINAAYRRIRRARRQPQV